MSEDSDDARGEMAMPFSVAPFVDFAAAAREVLHDLQGRLGLRLWLVTRLVGEHQVVLHSRDAPLGYGVSPGMVLSWEGSLCAAMVAGDGPHIAPRVADFPAFFSAPNREQAPIEAYVGFPLVQPDGGIFGTLCAFDPEPQPETLRDAEGLIRLQARLLSTMLHLELSNERLNRRAERAESDATTDTLTGLGNRRGWKQVVAAEEARCLRYGHPACVLVLDLNGLKAVNDSAGHAAGDNLLRECANVLADSARTSDYVARLGGDEFALLAVETDLDGGHAEAERVRCRLDAAGISAAVGSGVRKPTGNLDQAWHDADADMYRRKRLR